jgi:hypothetical protein
MFPRHEVLRAWVGDRFVLGALLPPPPRAFTFHSLVRARANLSRGFMLINPRARVRRGEKRAASYLAG